jgi:hypothetical protein
MRFLGSKNIFSVSVFTREVCLVLAIFCLFGSSCRPLRLADGTCYAQEAADGSITLSSIAPLISAPDAQGYSFFYEWKWQTRKTSKQKGMIDYTLTQSKYFYGTRDSLTDSLPDQWAISNQSAGSGKYSIVRKTIVIDFSSPYDPGEYLYSVFTIPDESSVKQYKMFRSGDGFILKRMN